MNSSRQAITFAPGEIEGLVCRPLRRFTDSRGWLTELFREDELPEDCEPAMGYLSETLPGIARGPHEHVDQTDLFAFVGPGDFRLFTWDTRKSSKTFGNKQVLTVGASNPMAVLIPPGIVHAYRNVSDIPALVLNFPNRLYRGPGKADQVDEIRHEDDPETPYRLDP